MARKMAFIPQELYSSYETQKPEIRLEQEITKLLDDSKLPDDLRVKLLGELIAKYHKVVHALPAPIKVSITDDLIEGNDNTIEEAILRDIKSTTPKRFVQIVPLIVEKLKSYGYSWNEIGELTKDDQPLHKSSITDLFSYLFRNVRDQPEPRHFLSFYKAIKEINIPISWIGNKNIKSRLNEDRTSDSIVNKIPLNSDSSSHEEETPKSDKITRRASFHFKEKPDRLKQWVKEKRWMEY